MTPEQRQQLRAEQSALAFEGVRDGGLIGKKSGPPPRSGPDAQGLNINYNTVKTVKLEKLNGRNRQRPSKRGQNKSQRTV